MTAPPIDALRAPLLDQVVELHPKHHASAIASSRLADLEAGCALSLSLELMAEAASLVFPHRHVVGLRGGEFFAALSPLADRPVRCQARQSGEVVEVSVLQTREGAEPVTIASAQVLMADSPSSAPTMPAGEQWTLDRRGRPHNAEALYGARELAGATARPVHPLVQWAAATGLGQLTAGLGPRGPHFGTLPASTPLPSSPGVVDGLCQLVQWQWYALSGAGGSVQAVGRVDWYRLPRADEELVGQVTCRGSVGGAPSFDAVAYGTDHQPTVELRGLRWLSRALSPEPLPLPRLDWQSFVRVLGGLGQTAS